MKSRAIIPFLFVLPMVTPARAAPSSSAAQTAKKLVSSLAKERRGADKLMKRLGRPLLNAASLDEKDFERILPLLPFPMQVSFIMRGGKHSTLEVFGLEGEEAWRFELSDHFVRAERLGQVLTLDAKTESRVESTVINSRIIFAYQSLQQKRKALSQPRAAGPRRSSLMAFVRTPEHIFHIEFTPGEPPTVQVISPLEKKSTAIP